MRGAQCKTVLSIGFLLSWLLNSLSVYGQTPKSQASLDTGPYYALIIGNNNYRYVRSLATPVNDAKEMAQLLQEKYGFATEVLLDADRNQILTALVKYRQTLPKNSNLLVYYAGHGHHDTDADEAYWLPVNAQANNNANWISSDDITRDVRALPSAHVLIISDSCYSGYLAAPRAVNAGIKPAERLALLTKMLESKSRNLMSSGSDEPVADNGAPGHSVFAAAVLESLKRIDDDNFTATDLFDRFIQPQVGGRSDQLPQYNVIRNSGHEYGDFIFSRKAMAKRLDSKSEQPPASGGDTRSPGSQTQLSADAKCLNGIWREQYENPLSWSFNVNGETLTITRTDNFVNGVLSKFGSTWSGQLHWGNGDVWNNVVLTPSADCSQVRTNQSWWYRR